MNYNKFQQCIDDVYNMYDIQNKKLTLKTENIDGKTIIKLTIQITSISFYINNEFDTILDFGEHSPLECTIKLIKNATHSLTDFWRHDYLLGKHVLLTAMNNTDQDTDDICESLMTKDEFSISEELVKTIIEILVLDIEKNHDKYYAICPICFCEKPINNMIIEPCTKCEPIAYDKIYDNIVTDTFSKDPNLFKLLLFTSLTAIDNVDRFTPIPKYCLSGTYEKEKLQPDAVNRNFDYYIKNIQISFTDLDLFKMIKPTEYMFLKHIILSNNTRLNYYDNSDGAIRNDDIWNTDQTILFTVDHPAHKQEKFDANPNVVHLYHGSPIQNFYSIMRNGLKNYSGTKLMTCGQAYGPGIYLGADMGTSNSYCGQPIKINDKGDLSHNNTCRIMGIVQVIVKESYKKTPNIYVVPDEENVLLKYLVMIRKIDNNDIHNYLTRQLPAQMKTYYVDAIRTTIKRLNKEESSLGKKIKKIKKENKNVDIKLNCTTINPNNEKDVENITNVLAKQSFAFVEWTIDIINKHTHNTKDNICITVQYSRLFPMSPPNIYLNRYIKIPMLNKTKTIINSSEKELSVNMYVDPIMRYDRWCSNIKIYEILNYMINDIIIEILD